MDDVLANLIPVLNSDEKRAYIARHTDDWGVDDVTEYLNYLLTTPLAWFFSEDEVLDQLYQIAVRQVARWN